MKCSAYVLVSSSLVLVSYICTFSCCLETLISIILPVPRNKESYLINAVTACCFVLMIMQGKTEGRGLNKLHVFWKEESLGWPSASETAEVL